MHFNRLYRLQFDSLSRLVKMIGKITFGQFGSILLGLVKFTVSVIEIQETFTKL